MTVKQVLALAKSYTDTSVEGAGAIKGKNCEIQSIEPITGGNRVTFAWYNGSDVLVTDTLDVMDGEDGAKGDKGDKGDTGATGATGNGIASIEKTSTVGNVDTYTITMTDGTTATFTVTNGGVNVVANPEGTASDSLTKIQIGEEIYAVSGGSGGASSYTELDDKPTMNGHTIIGDMVGSDLGLASASDIPDSLDDLSDDTYHRTVTDTEKTTWNGKADVSAIPTKTSDLTNDSGFITDTVNNLVNYYTKSQTYTQTEVDSLIAAAKNGRFISVTTLPTTDIDTKAIYLVPSADPESGNTKDEYINLTGTTAGWELIGSTAIDLSGYVTDDELTAALANYTNTTDLTTLLAAKQPKTLSEPIYVDGIAKFSVETAIDAVNGLAASNKSALLTKADTSQIAAIQDGQNIDSFSDVETALATKVDKVTGKGLSTNDYDNTAKGIVDNIQDNVIANTKLIKDTVGWSGKNKWDKSKTTGIDATITQTSDGFRAQVSNHTWGSARCDFPTPAKNKDFILTCKANVATAGNFMKMQVYGSTDGSDYSNSIAVTDTYSATKELELAFNSGNYNYLRITLYLTNGTAASADVTFEEPMLRDADILDSTYEPYHESVKEYAFPRSEQAVLGAVNQWPALASGYTYTKGGVTFTWLEDGSVDINGSSTSDFTYVYEQSNQGLAKLRGDWVARSLGSDSISGLNISLYKSTSSSWNLSAVNTEIPLTFTDAEHASGKLGIYVAPNRTFDHVVVKPVLYPATVPSDTPYIPYAMTNEQLTDAVKNIPTVSVSHTGTASSTGVRKQQITVNDVNYDIDGSAYMEQEVILSTSNPTTVTFTNDIIADGKTLTLETSLWDLVPDDMVTTAGVCTITLPKWSSAVTIGVRLRVR